MSKKTAGKYVLLLLDNDKQTEKASGTLLQLAAILKDKMPDGCYRVESTVEDAETPDAIIIKRGGVVTETQKPEADDFFNSIFATDFE